MAARTLNIIQSKKSSKHEALGTIRQNDTNVVISRESDDAVIFQTHIDNEVYEVEFLLFSSSDVKAVLDKQKRTLVARNRHIENFTKK